MKNKKPPDKPPDKLQIEKYENYKNAYKSVKISFASIALNNDIIIRINKIACRMNKIVIHTYNFIKMYCIYYYKINQSLPVIDLEFIRLVMKVVGKSDKYTKFKKESKDLIDDLTLFYDKYYEITVIERDKISYTNLTQLINYESELGLLFPVCDENIWDKYLGNSEMNYNKDFLNTFSGDKEILKKKWTYGSEFQLFIHYINKKPRAS